MAPLVKLLKSESSLVTKLCVTAQHREMLDQVLVFFKMEPDYDLNLMQVNQSLNKLSSRVFLQIGTGDNWAKESRLHLAGANNEELMYNKYTRARGYIPQDYLGFGNTTNHYHAGGGLNLRGYSGYLVPSENNNNNIDALNYQGSSGSKL